MLISRTALTIQSSICMNPPHIAHIGGVLVWVLFKYLHFRYLLLHRPPLNDHILINAHPEFYLMHTSAYAQTKNKH